MTSIETLARDLAFPEGPAFAPDGSLWCVELAGGALTRWDAHGLTRCAVGGAPNGLAFDAAGRAWVCDSQRNAIRRYALADGDSDATTVVATLGGAPLAQPNDVAFDARGNLLFTCPNGDPNGDTGYVCCLRPDGTLTQIASAMRFPNGLALIDGGRALVVAETYRRRLWRGAWDAAACRWVDPRPWADVGGTTDGPDGMALGADGLLYVAIYSLGCVKAIAQDGTTVAVYTLPGANPTNCAFDPSGRLGLVVTEAERGLLLSLPQLGPGAPLYDGGAGWAS